MKKLLSALFIVICLYFFYSDSTAQRNYFVADSNNVVLEECTGTWCPNCPDGHNVIATVLAYFPRTVVICYHGPPNYGNPQDPWTATGYPMIQLFGMSGYPTAVIGRTSGIQSRGVWLSYVSNYSANAPGVKIVVTNPTINHTTRVISASIDVTALQELTGNYNIFYVITEDKLIYPQSTPSGINSTYLHNKVSKALVNGTTGQQISTGTWSINQVKNTTLNYTVPSGIELANATLNIIVYKATTPYTTNAPIQNALATPLSSFTPVGITKTELEANTFNLGQNYPNPFNPQTSMRFTLPKDGNVSFRVYDINGKEVSNYFNGFLKAGIYTMQFDGSQLPSGVYFYKLTAGDFSDVKRMLLVK